MAEEQQRGDYNLPQMSTSSKEKNPEQKTWTPQSAVSQTGSYKV